MMSFSVYGQLILTQGPNGPTILNNLNGGGMRVSNIVLNCPDSARAIFNGSTTNIGLNSGVLLSTGKVNNAPGPNNTTSAGDCQVLPSGRLPDEPNLTALLNTYYGPSPTPLTRDACILEFDVQPGCDTLRVSFVFASEEYPEYIGSGFSDAMGIFVSGPGITGSPNIATLPTNVPFANPPVLVDYVNQITNNHLYVNNTGGTTIQYDGFTVKITAKIYIPNICGTYHVRIAIADGYDCFLDSGIFLEEGSMVCPYNRYEVQTLIQDARRGCNSGQMQFTRFGDTISGTSVPYLIQGDAVNGTDYQTISGNITFAPNSSTALLNIAPLMNGNPSGIDTVRILIGSTLCSVTTYDTAIVLIHPANLARAGNDTTICGGQNVPLGTTSTPGYTYSWTPATWLSATNISNPVFNSPVTAVYNYVVSQTDIHNCTYLDTVVIRVQAPAGNNFIGAQQTICSGQTPSQFTGTTPTGGAGVYSFQWESSSNLSSWSAVPDATQASHSSGPLSSTTYFRRVIVSGACPSNSSAALTISVLPLAGNNTIGANQTICTGSLPVTLTGSSPSGGNGVYSYQWESSTNLSTWSAIPGAFSSTYSPPVQSQTLYFRRTVLSGSCSVISNIASIITETTIVGNTPAPHQSICAGTAPSSFVMGAPSGGSGLYSYQWESSLNVINWFLISGANGSTYTSGNLSVNTYFRRIVTGGACPASTSSVVTVTVHPAISGNSIGNAQTVCSGTTMSALTASTPAGGTGSYVYQWQSSTNNSSWVNIGSGTQASYTDTPVLTSSVYFRRTIISGPCSSNSSSVYILVVPGITNNTIVSDQTICGGNVPAQFNGSLPAGGSGIYQYQWQSSLNHSTWADVTGANSQNYTSGVLITSTYFRRLVTSGACALVPGNSILVLVEPSIGNNILTSNQTVCTGSPGQQITGSFPSGGNGNYTYQWQSGTDNVNWNTIPGAASISYTPGVTNFQTYYRRLVSGGLCNASVSNTISIFAESLPGNNSVGVSQTICQGSTPALFTGSIPTGGSNVYTYQWQSSSDQLVWNSISGAINQQYQSTALSAVSYFRRLVSAGACPLLTSNLIQIQVTSPVSNNTILTSQTICQGGVPSTITGNIPGGGTGIFTYQWEFSTNQTTWTVLNGATGQDHTPGPLNAMSYFRRIVNSGPCSAASNLHTVVVNPGLGTITVGSDQTICLGNGVTQLTGTLPTGGSGTYIYQWQSSTDNSIWTNISQATNLNYQPSSPIGNIYFRRLVSSGACTNVAGNIVTITVVFTPSNNTIQSSMTICGGDIVQLTGSLPTGGTGSYSYVWESSTNNSSWNSVLLGNGGQNYTSGPVSVLTYFRRVVTAPPCSANSSTSVAIQPIPGITNNLIAPSQTICVGSTTTTLNGTIPGGGTGSYAYAWDSSSDSISWNVISGQSGQNYAPGIVNSSTYFRRRVLSGNCNIPSQSAVIIVEQPLSNNTLSGSQTLCFGQTASGIVGSVPSGGSGIYNYQWETSSNNSTWTSVPGATFISYAPPTPSSTIYLRRIVSGGLCSPSISVSATIMILPTITNNSIGSNQTICNGSAPALITGSMPSGGNGIFTYQWQSSANNSVWVNLGNATNQDYQPPILNNIAYFRRLASSSGCAGTNSNGIIITVQGGVTNNQIISSQTICAGGTPTGFLGSIPAGGTGVYVYQWLSSNDNSTWTNIVNGTQNNYSSPSLTQTTYFMRVVTSGLCPPSSSASISVLVQPAIGNNVINASQTLCSGTTPSLITGALPTGGTGTYSYIWQVSSNNSTWTNIGVGGLSLDYQPPALTQVTYYRRQVTSASCIPSFSNTVVMSILPSLGNNTIGSTQSICSGGNPSGFTGSTPTGGTGSYSYQWEFSADSSLWIPLIGSTNQVFVSGSLFATTYFRRIVMSGPCTLATAPVTIIVQQPIGNNTIGDAQTICSGGISFQLTGTVPSGGSGSYVYQWQSSINHVSWGNISAPQGTGLNFTPPVLTNSIYYRRVVTGGACSAVTSNLVFIQVDPPIGNNTLISNQTICRGSSASPITSLNLTGGNNTYSYQWESSTNSTVWSLIADATNHAYDPGSPVNTVYFRRTVVSGPCFSRSDTVVVQINELVSQNTILANQTICFGQSPATFTGSMPTGGTGQFSFQWQFSPDNVLFTSLPGETGQNFTSNQLFASTYFRRLVISGVCPPIASDTLLVFVHPPITGNTIGVNQTVCIGEFAQPLTGMLPSGGIGNYTYQWESSTNQSIWVILPGSTASGFTPPGLVNTTYYRRVVSSGFCNPVTSNIVAITIVPGITNNTITSNQTICQNSAPSGFIGSVPGGGSGIYAYQWQSSTDSLNWNSISIATQQNFPLPGNLSQTVYYRRIVTSGFCTQSSNAIQITIQLPIGNNLITAAQSLCAGVIPNGLSGSIPSGGSGSYTYQWQVSTNNSTYTNISGATNQDYQPPSSNSTVYYRRIVVSGVCPSSPSSSVSMVVQSGILGNAVLSNQTICQGNLPATLTGQNVSGGSGIYQFQWESSPNQTSWFPISGEIFQNLVPPLLTNTTYYRRIVNSGFCSDSSVAVIIRINQPIDNNAIFQNQTLCHGTSGYIITGSVPTGGNGLYAYQWESSPDQISWSSTGSNLQSFTVPVLSTGTYYRRVVVSAPCPVSTSNSVFISIVPVLSVNQIGSSQTICSGANPAVFTGTAPTGGTGVYLIAWETSTNNSTWSFAHSGQDYAAPPTFSQTYYRRILSSGPCGPTTSNTVMVTTITPLGNNTISSSQTLCAGNPYAGLTGPIPTGGSGQILYQWESSTDGLNWNSISGATSQNIAGGSVSVTTYFRRLVSATPCVSLPSNVVGIIIDTNIGGNTISGTQSICTGGSLTLTGGQPSGGNGIFTYQWQSSSNNTTWSGSIGNGQDLTIGPLTSSVYFRRIVSSGTCSSVTSTSFALTIEQNVSSNVIGSSQTICSSQVPSLLTGSTPLGGNGQFLYTWESSTNLSQWNTIPSATQVQYTPPVLNTTTYFRRVVQSAGVCPGTISSVFVTIDIEPEIGNNFTTASQTICIGQSPFPFSGSIATGGTGSIQYQWQVSFDNVNWSNVVGGVNVNYSAPSIFGATYYRRIASSTGVCAPNTGMALEIIPITPITNNTISPAQTVCAGSVPALLSGSSPSGGNGIFTYQWQTSFDNVNWLDATHATLQDYSSPPLFFMTYFRRVVGAGTCSNASNTLVLYVTPGLGNNTIATSQTLCMGINPSLLTGVTPTGGTGSYTYLWESSTDNLTWLSTGVTTISYQPAQISGQVYYRRLTTSGACVNVTTNVVDILMNPPISANTIQSAATLCEGSMYQLSGSIPSGGTGVFGYQWQSGVNNSSWQNITGATGQDYLPGPLQTTLYFRRVSTSGVCSASTSTSLLVTVQPALGNNAIGNNQTLCSGNTAATLIGTIPTGGNGVYTYVWESSNDLLTWGPVVGTTAVSPGVITSAVYYRRSITSGVCTLPLMSDTIQLIPNPPISNNTLASNQSVCTGQVPPGLMGSLPTGGVGIYTYIWETSSDQVNWNTEHSGTSPNYVPVPLSGNTYFRRIVQSGACPPLTSNTVSYASLPGIFNNVTGPSQTLCTGSVPAPLTGSIPTGGSGTYTYQWQSSSNNSTWTVLPGATQTGQAVGSPSTDVYYRRIVNSGTCADTSLVYIRVEQLLTGNIIGSSQTVCENTLPALFTGTQPSGGSGVYNYQWETSLNQVNWFVFGGGTSATLTGAPVTSSLYYRRVVSGGPCPSIISNPISIQIQPAITNNSIGSSQTLCSGQVPTNLTGSVPGGGTGVFGFQWQSSTDSLSWTSMPNSTQQNHVIGQVSQSTYFRRVVTSGVCITPANTVIVLVQPPIVNNLIGSSQTVCVGTSPSLLTGGMPSGGTGQFAYQWQSSSDNSVWSNITSGTSQNFGTGNLSNTFYYRRVITSGFCQDTSNFVLIQVFPVITRNFISLSQTICPGQTPNLLIGTLPQGGSGIYAYDWASSTDQVNWTTMPGQTAIDYQPGILSVTTYFRRTVTSGPCDNVSATLAITVVPPIQNNTISPNQSLCIGSPTGLITGSLPTGGGGNYQYSWLSSTAPIVWNTVSGQTGQNYQPPQLSVTTYYSRLVTSGLCSDTSAFVQIFVQDSLSNNVIQPSQTVCQNQVPSNLVGSTPSGGSGSYLYQWQTSTDNINWQHISGATLQNFLPLVTTQNLYYRRVVSGSVCPASTSAPVLVEVQLLIGNNQIGSDQTLCFGSAPGSLTGTTPTGGNGQYQYLWLSSTNAVNWSVVPGGNTIQYVPVTPTQTTYYRRVVISGFCSPDSGNTVTLRVDSLLANNLIGNSDTICAGSAPAIFTGTLPTGGNGSYAYTWQSSSNLIAWANLVSGTGQDYQSPVFTAQTYFRRIVSAGLCPPDTSAFIQIDVQPNAGNNLISSSQTICSNGTVAPLTGSLPTGGTGTYSYQWESSTDLINWQVATSGNQQNYTSGQISGTAYFRRLVSSGVCPPITSNLVEIYVYPPMGNNRIDSVQTICSGTAPAAFTGSLPSGGVGTYTYQWQSGIDNSTWQNITGSIQQNYASPALTVNTYFRRIVFSGPCSDTTSSIAVQVVPVAGNNTIGASQTLCFGQMPGIMTGTLPTGGTGVYTYAWESSTDQTLWNAITGATGTNYQSPVLTGNVYFRRVVTAAPCAAFSSNVVTIVTYPLLGNNVIDSSQVICSGNIPAPLSGTLPSGGSGQYTYQWLSSATSVGPWVSLPGSNTQQFSSGPITSLTYFRRVVISGACQDTSTWIVISTTPGIGNNQITQNQNLCIGSTPAQLSGTLPTGGNGSYTYSWESSVDNVNWQIAGGTNQNFTPPALTQTRYYRRIVSGGPCPVSTSSSLTIQIDSLLGNNILNTTSEVCFGSTAPAITGSIPTGGSSPYTYLWQTSNDSITWNTIPGVISQSINPGIMTTSLYYRRVVSGGVCPGITSAGVFIRVVPVITTNTIGTAQTVCAGVTPNILLGSLPGGGNGNFVYSWESSPNNVNWVQIPGATQQDHVPSPLIGNVHFRRVITSGPCTSASSSVLITVDPVIGNNILIQAQTLCSGQSAAVITGTVPTGGNGQYNYLWQSSNDNINWSLMPGIVGQNFNPGIITATTWYRRFVSSSPCSQDTSASVSITILPVLGNNTISSNQTVCTNQAPPAFTGSLPSGGNGSYQYVWLSATNMNGPWGVVPGANQIDFTSGNLNQNTYFRRLVSSLPCTDTSQVVSVLVNPGIGTNTIMAAQVICTGDQPASLTGSLPSGGNGIYNYQWETSLDGFAWSTLSGASNQNYTPPILTASLYYRRIVSDGSCPASSSANIMITVNQNIGNNTIVTNQTICTGQSPNALSGSNPSGGNGNYIYQWQSSIDNVTWSNQTGAINSGFAPGILTTTTYYRRLVTAGPCATDTSNSVIIFVLPAIGQNSIQSDQTICEGQPVSVLTGSLPTGGNGLYTYVWESSTNNVNWNPYTGGVQQNLTPPSLISTTWFRRIVNSDQCTQTSSVLQILVQPILGNNTIGSDQTLCSGQSANPLTGALPTGGTGTFAYQWESSSDNIVWANWGNGNTQNIAPGNISQTLYFRRIVSGGVCDPNTSQVITIIVANGLSNNLIGSNQTICTGLAPALITGTLPAGGSGVYAYQWLSSATPSGPWNLMPGETQIDLQPGILTGTVYYRRFVSGGPCSDTTGIVQVIVNLPLVNNQIGSNQTICTGTSPQIMTGQIPQGGNGNYVYVWETSTDNLNWQADPSGTTASYTSGAITQLTYYRRIVSAGPCNAITSNTIQIFTDPVIGDNVVGNDQTICAGFIPAQLTGSLPTGGNGTYLYQWQSSTDNINWSNAGAGNLQNYLSPALSQTLYFRRLVSAGACAPATSAVTVVTVDPVIGNNTVLSNQTICIGSTPATLSGALPTGGNGVYGYTWESSTDGLSWNSVPGVISIDYLPPALTVNTYYRRIVSSSACVSTSTPVSILINQQIGNNIVGTDQTLCATQVLAPLTGTLPTGGNGVYQYVWESSSDQLNWQAVGNGTNQNLNYGTILSTLYFRRIINAGPCAAITSQAIEIYVYPVIGNNQISTSQTICFGSNPTPFTGALPTGGVGVYAYQWESSTAPGGPWNVITGETGQNFTEGSLTATRYYRRSVTSLPCTDNSNVIAVIVNPLLGNNTVAASQTLCIGSAFAALTGPVPTGGNGVYTFDWQSSSDNVNWSSTGVGISTHPGLSPVVTTYYRRVVSAGVCPGSTSNALIIVVEPVPGNNQIGSHQTICSNRVPSLITGTLPTGGSGQYQYRWESAFLPAPLNWQTVAGATQRNYQAGSITQTIYYRRVVSAGACAALTSNEIMIFVNPNIGNNIVGANQTLCTGAQPAFITGSLPTGGNGNYSYQWESSGNNVAWVSMPGEISSGILPGILTQTTYFRRLVQAGICDPSTSNVVTILIQQNVAGNSVSSDQTICEGQVPNPLVGTLPGGGSGSYSYQWQSSINQLNWIPVAGSTGANYSPGALLVNTYFRRIVSSGACGASTSMEVSILVLPPAGNNAITSSQTLCAGDIPVLLTGTVPTGGSGVYQYQWQSSTDGAAWSPIPGVNTDVYAPGGLSSTAYYRRVVVSGACVSNSNAVIIRINAVPVITSPDTVICQGQSVTLTAQADVPGGIYTWNVPPFNTSSVTVSPLVTTTYTVDYVSGGCFAASHEVVVTVNTIPDVRILLSGSGVFCAGQTLVLTANPSGMSQYSWTLSGTGVVGNGATFAATLGGTYILNVNDGNGCTAADTVVLSQGTSLVLQTSGTSATCLGGNDGVAGVSVTGGTAPYSYLWNNGSSTPTITNLPAGNYTVIVTDAEGCTSQANVNIVNPGALSASMSSIVPVRCFGRNTGALTIGVNGGTPPYTYSWSTAPVQTGATASNLPAGSYTVLVTDANGCFTTSSAIIPQPATPLVASITVPPAGCAGEVWQMFGEATGGTPPYSYQWSPPVGLSSATAQNPFVTYSISTSYTLVVTDASGCQDSDNDLVTVNVKPVADFRIQYITEDSTFYNNDEVTVVNFSTPPNAQWSWDLGDGTMDTVFEPRHIYSVEDGVVVITLIASTPEGCKDTTERYFKYKNVPNIYVPTAFSPNGDGINDFFNIAYISLTDFVVLIFDRWGNKMYQHTDPSFRWDGTLNGNPLPEGVYTIYIKGIDSQNDNVEYSGTVTLFR